MLVDPTRCCRRSVDIAEKSFSQDTPRPFDTLEQNDE